ncbi:PhzF family phenazine biosynthesis protein [Stutzerimonas azotifigens]|uniref:PhzF family phenazine biosynthesis protein n=1 Tax=Stutzerimonas azotifigens TaxID=291995 RepID=UPI0003FD9262|nr:PhzF family phenazine biosynthesis protein [Stutzerimonas azotifigens]
MRDYRFRILNVFAESTFGGNPLCVFEGARGLSDAEMLALARQFNLSETTFILPSERADARVRIFTPGYEMRFAGHPTLGTAAVVGQLRGAGPQVTLEFTAAVVPVACTEDVWTFEAPVPGEPALRPTAESPATIAALFGLVEQDLAAPPCWVDTGADQLLIPLRSRDALERAAPDSSRLADWPLCSLGSRCGYLFSLGEERDGRLEAHARFFFTTHGSAIAEDPGTGSACANLGGWLLGNGHPASRLRVQQGAQVGRPCTLLLDIQPPRGIRVGGRVLELGRGSVRLPA